MKRILAILAALGLAVAAAPASAEPNDPLGDLIAKMAFPLAAPADWQLKATLYHAGARGIRAMDSLGCPVSPMRTLAVDPDPDPAAHHRLHQGDGRHADARRRPA
ncbi:MAG: hypothetical protein WDM85_18510 [Caulobacteraceae bacterium]